MKLARFAGCLVLTLGTTAGAAADGVHRIALEAFAPLWRSLPAASDTLVVPHPVYVLVRAGDRVRATALGHFEDDFRLPPGARLQLKHGDYLEVWADRPALEALAASPAVLALYPPLRFQPAVVTEARAAMGMQAFDAAGDAGQGVRVAVVDLGFSGWEALRGTELPANTYFKSFLNSGSSYVPTEHGTAVAEIIHDVAPQAEIYLLQIAETADLVQAVDWCIDNSVHVANMSLAFIGGPRDGTGYQAEQVNRAVDAGVIWVCSAGNEAATHWQGIWRDDNANGVLDVGPNREVVAFTYPGPTGSYATVLTQLVWDLWPSTSGLSFDLEIYRDSLRTQPMAASNGFPSLSLAHRMVVLEGIAAGRYYISVVHRFGAIPAGLRFDLYLDNNIAHQVAPADPAGSLVSPADARGAVAVGAYDFSVATPGASPVRTYSSRGPTWDGRLKPELVAGDGVSTQTYGPRGFFGTSASSPHVAGAAAVLSGATVSGGLFTYIWSVEDFLRLLSVNSIDFGTPGLDNVYGRGGLVLPPASADPALFQVTAYPNPFNGPVRISFPLRLGASYRLRVFDLLGRLVYRTDGLHTRGEHAQVDWCGCGLRGEPLPSGVYFYRVDTDYESGMGRAVLLR